MKKNNFQIEQIQTDFAGSFQAKFRVVVSFDGVEVDPNDVFTVTIPRDIQFNEDCEPKLIPSDYELFFKAVQGAVLTPNG